MASAPLGGVSPAELSAAEAKATGDVAAHAHATKSVADDDGKPQRSRFRRIVMGVWDLICEHW